MGSRDWLSEPWFRVLQVLFKSTQPKVARLSDNFILVYLPGAAAGRHTLAYAHTHIQDRTHTQTNTHTNAQARSCRRTCAYICARQTVILFADHLYLISSRLTSPPHASYSPPLLTDTLAHTRTQLGTQMHRTWCPRECAATTFSSFESRAISTSLLPHPSSASFLSSSRRYFLVCGGLARFAMRTYPCSLPSTPPAGLLLPLSTVFCHHEHRPWRGSTE